MKHDELTFEHQSLPKTIYDKLKSDEGFRTYLDKVWANRMVFYDYSQEEISLESRRKKGANLLHFEEKCLTAKNYIGFLQYNDVTIEIWPKIFKHHKNKLNSKQLFFNHILYYFSYSQRIRFPFSNFQFEEQNFDNLLDTFVRLFANYTERILSEQPYQRYEEVTEEMNYLRGRLAMPEYITQNLSTGQWHKLHCTYEPFVYDNLFNRIVKYTTRYLLQLSPGNYQNLENILFLLDDVSDVPCTVEDCQQVQFNPIHQDLQHILDMCRMFLANEMISHGENSKNHFSFVLPMERVFEDFIAGFIKEHFTDEWEIRPQASDLFLTSDKTFQLRHDILLKNRTTKEHIIFDTKYKKRHLDGQESKYGISQADMYQMVSYIIRRDNCKIAVLLYPRTSAISSKNFEVEYVGWDQKEHLQIWAFDVNVFSEDLKELEENLKTEIKGILNDVQKSIPK